MKNAFIKMEARAKELRNKLKESDKNILSIEKDLAKLDEYLKPHKEPSKQVPEL